MLEYSNWKAWTSTLETDDHWEAMNLTALHMTVIGLSKNTDLSHMLSLNHTDINKHDVCGRTPLMWAANRGLAEAVQTLLDWKAEVNLVSSGGMTALHYAVRRGSIECVRHLIEAGADVHTRHWREGTLLHMLAFSSFSSFDKSLAIVQALVRHGLPVDARNDDGYTSLHITPRFNSPDCARVLLENGADTEAMNSYQETPLALAIMHNSIPVTRVLKNHGARLDLIIKGGANLVEMVAGYGSLAMMEELTTWNIRTEFPQLSSLADHSAWEFFETYREKWYIGPPATKEEERSAFATFLASLSPARLEELSEHDPEGEDDEEAENDGDDGEHKDYDGQENNNNNNERDHHAETLVHRCGSPTDPQHTACPPIGPDDELFVDAQEHPTA